MRVPLVDGQGNFGSMDGDSAAAMRYTEAKLSSISSYLVNDINHETVNFKENYDGTTLEPELLPAEFQICLWFRGHKLLEWLQKFLHASQKL